MKLVTEGFLDLSLASESWSAEEGQAAVPLRERWLVQHEMTLPVPDAEGAWPDAAVD